MKNRFIPGLIALTINTLLLLAVFESRADTLNIAVASNFASTMRSLANDFQNKTGHKLLISSASTGKLYSQINHGAPFDVFLAADEKRPDILITEGKASPENAHTYALGKLVLMSNIKHKNTCHDVLQSSALKRFAIANPKTAPYGFAAQQVLEKLGQWKNLQSKLVMGENIAQTLQFVSTTNAEAGFVAKSMLSQNTSIKSSCTWDVPSEYYSPIKQKMVILSSTTDKQASQAFLKYMQSDAATKIIKTSGYDVI
jgi:molybdate transport system substrate-binding protein